MDVGSKILEVSNGALKTHDILFFDGVCGLCDRIVQFVLSEDSEHQFLFSPIQGKTIGQLNRGNLDTVEGNTMLVLRASDPKRPFLVRSDAVLYVLSQLPRFRWIARLGFIFPPLIRDAVYRVIAGVRYKLWGRTLRCRLPKQGDSDRFLP
jgi:predicted DCC family thiol-disulfide oxidoreductase YuxK